MQFWTAWSILVQKVISQLVLLIYDLFNLVSKNSVTVPTTSINEVIFFLKSCTNYGQFAKFWVPLIEESLLTKFNLVWIVIWWWSPCRRLLAHRNNPSSLGLEHAFGSLTMGSSVSSKMLAKPSSVWMIRLIPVGACDTTSLMELYKF